MDSETLAKQIYNSALTGGFSIRHLLRCCKINRTFFYSIVDDSYTHAITTDNMEKLSKLHGFLSEVDQARARFL